VQRGRFLKVINHDKPDIHVKLVGKSIAYLNRSFKESFNEADYKKHKFLNFIWGIKNLRKWNQNVGLQPGKSKRNFRDVISGFSNWKGSLTISKAWKNKKEKKENERREIKRKLREERGIFINNDEIEITEEVRNFLFKKENKIPQRITCS
jgi:hypothetical protein